MHLHIIYHIVGKVARGVESASVFYGMHYHVNVLLAIYIKRWHCPCGFWFFRFLFHVEHTPVFVQHYHSRALQLFFRRLVVAHDAWSALLLGELHESLEREKQQVICGNHQHVVIHLCLFNGKL